MQDRKNIKSNKSTKMVHNTCVICRQNTCVTEKICITGELRSVINLWLDDYSYSLYKKSKCWL